MADLIGQYGDLWRTRRVPALTMLTRIIVGQQISVKAAATIYERLETRCGGKISAGQLLRLEEAAMQECGLSRQKRAGLKDLAARVHEGRLRPDQIWRLDDRAARDAITSVRGLGPWSAEVFLMFGLGRPDLLPTDDLGLRAGFRLLLGSRRNPAPSTMERVARPWRPWRTLACLYLWALLDSPPDRKKAS
jgi:DNA-3-methyladenine glycosylase II